MSQTRAWLLALASFSLAACGGGLPDVKVGPMPDGGDFTGVYFSPQYGEMQLIQNGSKVRGEYKKDEREGKITGDVDGNVLRFEWVEAKAMIANRPTETRGRGYFAYMIDPANGDHVIKGRWGLGDDDRDGGEWNAYKAKKREPHLSSDDSASSEEGSGGEYYDESLGADEGDDDSGGGDEEDDDLGF